MAGYNYVVFHYGNGNAGSPGGWWQAFYLGGQDYLFATPTVGGRSVGGFSSARYFGVSQVPDSGATLMLLELHSGSWKLLAEDSVARP